MEDQRGWHTEDRFCKALVGSNLPLFHSSTGVMPLLPFYLLQKPLRQCNVLACVGAFIYELPQQGHVPDVDDQDEEAADIAPRQKLGRLMGSGGAGLSTKDKF